MRHKLSSREKCALPEGPAEGGVTEAQERAEVEAIARTILAGFDKHYRLFRHISANAKRRFEQADWSAAQEASRSRIRMYDQRVVEAVAEVSGRFPRAAVDGSLWPRIKIAFIGLLYDHSQPECAETFYNSVACGVLNREYYHNTYIFWRPAISLDHIEGAEPTYRVYYPPRAGLRRCLLEILSDFGLECRFEDLRRDLRYLLEAFAQAPLGGGRHHPNHQLQVLSSLFFRGKAAYVVGREINGDDERPFAVPILHNDDHRLYLDAFLHQPRELAILFSFSRAYFMVDMEVPSAYVNFLHAVLPRKPLQEIYSMLGLHKQSKTMFYRDLQHHLKHSTDNFIIAPGIRGMVMLVFTLPSFPFVFKVIRDTFEKPKDLSRAVVKEKYLLVKSHDRAGRLADTLEYSHVALPRDRIDPALLTELEARCASSLEFDGDRVVIAHLYIEKRMSPLNEYLSGASDARRRHAIDEFGRAIRDLAGANIFPGDMMLKNFGVTRHLRVVFYDYDEIRYLTECNFRHIPPAPSPADELLSQPWYSVGPDDVFPEQFAEFFFSDPESRRLFYRNHRALIDPDFWIGMKRRILSGDQPDVIPYPEAVRFCVRFGPTVPDQAAPASS